jgi:prolyl-tRNA synthetase
LVRRDNIEGKITINLEESEVEKRYLLDFEKKLTEDLEKYNPENKTKEKLSQDKKEILSSIKRGFKRDKIVKVIIKEIDKFKKNLYQKSTEFRDKHIFSVDSFTELEQKIKKGIKGLFLVPFCNNLECEIKIKEKVPSYSIRCIAEKKNDIELLKCLFCQSIAQNKVYLGRSY